MKTLVLFFGRAFLALLLVSLEGHAQVIGNYFAPAGSAGFSNTTGSDNTFVGVRAGYSNTDGYFNTFLGTHAGASNTTGNYNTFLGRLSGFSNVTGDYNTFVGQGVGYANMDADNNAFFGAFVGISNYAGEQNLFLGNYTGHNNTTGSNNSFAGYSAGYYNEIGSNNTFMGFYTGLNNRTGVNNSFLGYFAGHGNLEGNYNSFFGDHAGYSNAKGSYDVFMGFQAGFRNSSGTNNAFIGNSSGFSNTYGGNNVAVGTFAGYHNKGNNNTYLGSNANTSTAILTNSTAIGNRAYVTASNSLVLGSIAGVNGATTNINVGIGTSAPAYQLQLSTNSAAKPGSNTWVVASDRRLKKDVSSFTDGLEVLKKVRPVWFRYNGEIGLPTNQRYVGIIAQEMQKIAPYTVGKFTCQDNTGNKTEYLDYDANALTYILVNAVQELGTENEGLKKQLETLEARLNRLEQLLQKQPTTATYEGEDAARLWQNEPNPADGKTIIRYRIPTTATTAQLKFFSITGQELYGVTLTEKGDGQLILQNNLLPAGAYIYHLLINGLSIDAKKLVLTK